MMMPLTRFKCSACQDEWDSAVYRKHRYCPGCGNTENLVEVPLLTPTLTSTGVVYDGGGSRSASPVEPPHLGSLVFIKRKSTVESNVTPYWDLVSVTGAVDLESDHPAFCTLCEGNFLLSDVGNSWKPAPVEYMTFLASLNLPFEHFAMELARGGIEGVTGKVAAPLTDWGVHNASRYRGVAQVALSLLSHFFTTQVDLKQKLLRAAKLRLKGREATSKGHVSQKVYDEQVRENADLRNRIAFAQQVLGGVDVRKA